jgi:hypothetical protein
MSAVVTMLVLAAIVAVALLVGRYGADSRPTADDPPPGWPGQRLQPPYGHRS